MANIYSNPSSRRVFFTSLATPSNRLVAQGSSAFVVGSPTQAPDQLGGGVWVRGVGGNVLASAPSNGGGNLWITKAAIDSEASGYFLVPAKLEQAQSWRNELNL
jgi:hypothetical protein